MGNHGVEFAIDLLGRYAESLEKERIKLRLECQSLREANKQLQSRIDSMEDDNPLRRRFYGNGFIGDEITIEMREAVEGDIVRKLDIFNNGEEESIKSGWFNCQYAVYVIEHDVMYFVVESNGFLVEDAISKDSVVL